MQATVWNWEIDALPTVTQNDSTYISVDDMKQLFTGRWITKKERHVVPAHERCIALKTTKGQCTRRRQIFQNIPYCKTHEKERSRPNGVVVDDAPAYIHIRQIVVNNVQLFADEHDNIYDTDEVINRSETPRVVGKIIEVDGEKQFVPK